MRFLTLLYGVVAYLVFFGSFLYAIAFVGNFDVPRTVDRGPVSSLGTALAINLALLGLFAVQHSVMARQGFKAWWTKIVPKPAERSTYVLLASAILLLLFWQWRPLPATVWSIEQPVGRGLLQGFFWAGWALVLLGTFQINHCDLFGLRQVWLHVQGKVYTPVAFRQPFLYRVVRHPVMLGFAVAFWATPMMTAGHLLFAVATTGYIVIGIWFEERDLLQCHGETYATYRRQVSMLLPRLPQRQPR